MPTINKRFPLIIFIVVLFTGFTTGIANKVNETFKKQILTDGIPKLTVKNSNGKIEVSSWDKDEISIEAYIHVKARDSEATKILDRVEIEVEQDGNEIFVETLWPGSVKGNDNIFSWLFGDNRGSVVVDYEIFVPFNSDLDLNTSNGGISIRDVSGNLLMHSINGKINASGISGFMICETTNGKIVADINKVESEEEIIFRTTNGSIRVYLPDDFGGYADLKTINGRIDSDFRLYGEYNRNRHSKNYFKGEIGKGNGTITCKTTNGSIYLLKNN